MASAPCPADKMASSPFPPLTHNSPCLLVLFPTPHLCHSLPCYPNHHRFMLLLQQKKRSRRIRTYFFSVLPLLLLFLVFLIFHLQLQWQQLPYQLPDPICEFISFIIFIISFFFVSYMVLLDEIPMKSNVRNISSFRMTEPHYVN